MRDQSIKRIMTTNPAAIRSGEPASNAHRLLETGQIHHLPVVDGDKLVGIVSSSDLLKLHLLDEGVASAANLTVDAIMQKDPLTLDDSASLRDAAAKLSIGGFHSLPIVNNQGMLVGIVTSTDLIDHLLKQLPTGDGSLAEVSTAALLTRNKVLEQVCRAAELYERSGHAEREHSVLLKALAAARSGDQSVNL